MLCGGSAREYDGEGNADQDLIDWREVDRRLRRIARHRAALDAEEARWLRMAVRLEVWRAVGQISMRAYLEDVLGYGPHGANERLRVAEALGTLPKLEAALGTGELSYSAVRELTRVATPATERAWLVAADGKNLREIEELVTGRRPGDLPGDPADPALFPCDVRFRLRPETFALLRQARQVLEDERGAPLEGDELVAALCGAVLARPAATEADAPEHPKYQIGIVTCAGCERAWQQGAGVHVPIDPAARERAECDAQRIGRLNAPLPERARQEVPPRVRRLVWRRDGGRCRVPGCRSTRNLELHHVRPRSAGGRHTPDNLALLCDGHHAAVHRGVLAIHGTAPDRLVFVRPEQLAAAAPRSHVGPRAGPGAPA